mmetsp:Transcript_8357/g.17508  ORF Transcript_8357/g.17508 Transcript_8357/m.17508 type:complete len:92 (-) Transcript_8357:492-767(-)
MDVRKRDPDRCWDTTTNLFPGLAPPPPELVFLTSDLPPIELDRSRWAAVDDDARSLCWPYVAPARKHAADMRQTARTLRIRSLHLDATRLA